MNKVDKCKIENMNFGNFLKELKLEKDLTLKDIAGRSEISYQTILKMTSTEKRKPTLEQFLKIMVSTNSSLDEYLEDMLDKPKTSRKRLSIVKKFASYDLSVL